MTVMHQQCHIPAAVCLHLEAGRSPHTKLAAIVSLQSCKRSQVAELLAVLSNQHAQQALSTGSELCNKACWTCSMTLSEVTDRSVF